MEVAEVEEESVVVTESERESTVDGEGQSKELGAPWEDSQKEPGRTLRTRRPDREARQPGGEFENTAGTVQTKDHEC